MKRLIGQTLGAGLVAGIVLMALTAAGGDVAPDTATALAKVKLFAHWTQPEREALLPAATVVNGKAGDRVIEQGKLMSRMLIVLDGQAEVRVGGKPVATLADQPLIGEIEFLQGIPATADVFLLNDSVLLLLDNAKLKDALEAHPRVGYLLMSEIAKLESERLRRMNPK